MFYDESGHFKYESLGAVVLSWATWTAVYLSFRYLLPHKSSEYCERINSFFHGFFSFFLGINQCFVPDNPFGHPEWRTTHFQSFILVYSVGYFLFDTLVMILTENKDGKLMMFHHVYCVFALLRILYKGYSGAQTTCGLGCMEITNPFLQARWFIRSEGYYPSVLYTSVETTFFLVFVGVRIIFGTYYMWVIATHPKNDWEFIVLSFAIYIMSWLFIFQMLEYIARKYLRGRREEAA